MYRKPDTTPFHDYSPSGGETLSTWRHGLSLRIPTNYNKDFTVRKLFPKRTKRGKVIVKKSPAPQDSKRIIVDKYTDALDDDLGFRSSTEAQFNSNSNLDREVNVFSFEGTGYKRNRQLTLDNEINYASELLDARRLDKTVNTLLRDSNKLSHWDEQTLVNFSKHLVLMSVSRNIATRLGRIRTLAGDYKIPIENIDIIRNRIIDGSLEYSQLTTDGIRKYADDLFYSQKDISKKAETAYTIKSRSHTMNEKFAIAYVQQFMRELSPSAYASPFNHIHDIYRTLSTDLNKKLPISTASGTVSSIPISLTETIRIDGSGSTQKKLLVENGDFFIVDDGRGSLKNLKLETEVHHAFRLASRDKERVLNLLNVRDLVKITVDSEYSKAVEYTNDLNVDGNKPRDPYYFLKLNTSSIQNPKKINLHVDQTDVNYSLITDANEINDWTKFNTNMAFYTVEHDDLFLDYLVSSTTMKANFRDFTFRVYGTKDSEDVPIMARDIPWSIILLPTDKIELNPYKVRSHISNFDSTGTMSRSLFMEPHFDSRQAEQPLEYFVNVSASDNIPENVYREKNTGGAAVEINSTPTWIASALASGVGGVREKTPIRILAEIITELSRNYSLNGGVSWFDVISRLTVNEFARLSILENAYTYLKSVENGLIGRVKLYHTFAKDSNTSLTGSRLKFKKESVGDDADDIFFPIKLHTVRGGSGYRIIPPTTTEGPTLELVDIADANKTFSGYRLGIREVDIITNIITNPSEGTEYLGETP